MVFASLLQTLKRRKRGIVRQVPLPPEVLRDLNHVFEIRHRQRDPDLAAERLWKWSRTTGWRRVKEIMAAAGVIGVPATPKGLRHGFGVNAFQSSVPFHLVQRWLGHLRPRSTTAATLLYRARSSPGAIVSLIHFSRPAKPKRSA
jgi:integrase/recombinase XerD